MDRRVKTAFLALVLTQMVHSVEEYAFGFSVLFPPARLLNGLLPGFTHPGFVIFNALLAGLGLWCFFFSVRPGAKSARKWIWLWVVIELFNGIGHSGWAVAARGYVPGLITSVPLLALAAYLVHLLRAKLEESPE